MIMFFDALQIDNKTYSFASVLNEAKLFQYAQYDHQLQLNGVRPLCARQQEVLAMDKTIHREIESGYRRKFLMGKLLNRSRLALRFQTNSGNTYTNWNRINNHRPSRWQTVDKPRQSAKAGVYLQRKAEASKAQAMIDLRFGERMFNRFLALIIDASVLRGPGEACNLIQCVLPDMSFHHPSRHTLAKVLCSSGALRTRL